MVDNIQDLNLPNSVVARIIKEALPDGINVAKEARTAIARAASVFGKRMPTTQVLIVLTLNPTIYSDLFNNNDGGNG